MCSRLGRPLFEKRREGPRRAAAAVPGALVPEMAIQQVRGRVTRAAIHNGMPNSGTISSNPQYQ